MPSDLDPSDDLEDPELPDESDMDSFDEPNLTACPHCRKMINEDAERCHHCGEYISEVDRPSVVPLWLWITAVVMLIVILFFIWRRGQWS